MAIETDNRVCAVWYIKYRLDGYALGPLRYDNPVQADRVSNDAVKQFGERPAEIWPTGRTEEVPEYEYEVTD
jgi:hypothetical protein